MDRLSLYSIFGLLILQGVHAVDGEVGITLTSSYYDCCKPDCAWEGQSSYMNAVRTCDANNNPLTDLTEASYCDGGAASVCTEQMPWAVNDTFSYGFASIYISNAELKSWCCTCYELQFLDSPIAGKRMIVQGINTNYNEGQSDYFSLTVPGQADWKGKCQERYNGTSGGLFGMRNTYFVASEQCDKVPEDVRGGCQWRYDWYKNAGGANATFRRVACPKVLTDKTGCYREDDATFVPSEIDPSLTQGFLPTAPSIAARLNPQTVWPLLLTALAVWISTSMMAL